MFKLKLNVRAFHTIELITSILVISMLVLLAGPNMLNYATEATKARQDHEDKVVRDIAIFQYYAKNGRLPKDSIFIEPDEMIDLTYINDENGNKLTKDNVTIVHEGYLVDSLVIHKDSKYYRLPNKFLSKVLDRTVDGHYYYDTKTGNLIHIN